jgi:hypothetical protein
MWKPVIFTSASYIPPEDIPDQKSITDLEYSKTAERGKRRLGFSLYEAFSWPPKLAGAVRGRQGRGARTRTLRDKLGRERTVDFFKNQVHPLSTSGRSKQWGCSRVKQGEAAAWNFANKEQIGIFQCAG